MINKKKIYLFVIIIIFFLIDRVSKILILKSFLNNSLSEIYINSFLNFSLVWNSGIGFGLLQIEPNIFYSTVSIIIAAINLILIYWMITTSNYLESIFISIILGGSLGNLFDRFYYNSVPDFIDLHYKSFHWFTFNIADIFITIGIIGLIINKKNMKKILSLLVLLFLLPSCENVQKGLGMKKDVPNEFLIEKRNPLTMPPNFDLLPPDSVNQNNQKDEKDNLKEIFNKNLGKDKQDSGINKGTDSGSLEKSILEKIK